ncbi:MAG: sensor histidine kinase [Candidatus Limnocylindrales bacterium]
MTWSPERRAILIGALLVAWSVTSVRIGFAGFEQRQAVLTLLAGWFVAACGLLTWLQAPRGRIGPLLLVLSAAWFVGGFRWLDISAPGELASWFATMYRAVAVHAILTFPTGRTRGTRQVAVILAAYAATLLPPTPGTVVVAAILFLGLGLDINTRGLDPAARRRRRPAWIVGVGLAGALLATEVLLIVLPGSARFDARLIDQLTTMAVAACLSVPLVRETSRRARVTDLVVDLDPARGGLARELAQAIGDSTLRVGYWLPEQRRYVDPTGQVIELPLRGSGRGTTTIKRDGDPVAVLIHDPAVTIDPAIRAAMARAAQLAVANARLQVDVRAQAATVDASRRRILQASDIERRALQDRLRHQVEPTLATLEAEIAEASAIAAAADPSLERAREQLRQARLDLADMTEHLHPRALDERGLRGAIGALAARAPVPVTLEWETTDPIEPEIQAALYYVCSEALANVAKHANASRVFVRVSDREKLLRMEVEDDGRGGAAMGPGTGLLGLQDRLATVDGDLAIQSGSSGGTRLIATVPNYHRM